MSKDTKKPMIPWKEFQERRPTVNEVARWPDCNIAIVTGEISGLAVIDCESRDDAVWFYRHKGKSPSVVRTRRGYHLYFQHPGQCVQNGIKFDNRYDVRGDGGYVLAPPSVHSEGEYAWSTPLQADLPVFQMEWRPASRHSEMRSSRGVCAATAHIQKIFAVEGNGGHNATYHAACVLCSSGMGEAEALLALQDWNRTNAQPPWSDRELLHKIRSAYVNGD